MRRFTPAILLILLAAPAGAHPLAGAARDVTAIIDGADANRDGRIDRGEITVALRRAEAGAPAAFEAWWAARNAAIAGGLPAVPDLRGAGREALGVLAEADADADGAVSAEEAQAYVAGLPPERRQAALYAIALADVDFDGTATRDEVEALRARVEALGGGSPAAPPEEIGEEAAAAKAEARKDFLEGKAREREAIEEAWRMLSDANNAAPAADLRREVFGGPN